MSTGKASPETVTTTVRLPRTMRAALDATRMERARRTRSLPLAVNDLVLAAIAALLARERHARAAKRKPRQRKPRL